MMIKIRSPRRFLDICLESLYALRDNKLRTILSILGIMVGIAAVITVGAVSKGGRFVIFSELETFGLKSVWVYRNYVDKNPRRAVRAGTGIETDDYLAIQAAKLPSVDLITPVIFKRGGVKSVRRGNNFSNAQVNGVGLDYLKINNDTLLHGRAFLDDDITRHRHVAVIGTEVRQDLFGASSNPVGRDIRVGERKFTIIGVLKAKSRDFLASIGSAGGQNSNNRLLIPYPLYQKMTGTKEINSLQAQAISLAQADMAASRIKAVLERRQQHRYDYRSETMAQYIRTANNILRWTSLVGVVAASVSLFVGGMGIVNIMSTSVLERTREIGIRKAMGAGRKEILLQFLMEAIFISFIGGTLGLTAGIGVAYVMVSLTGIPLTPSLPTVLISLAVSAGVGLISGYYPAYRAANLKPVEALRFE